MLFEGANWMSFGEGQPLTAYLSQLARVPFSMFKFLHAFHAFTIPQL